MDIPDLDLQWDFQRKRICAICAPPRIKDVNAFRASPPVGIPRSRSKSLRDGFFKENLFRGLYLYEIVYYGNSKDKKDEKRKEKIEK